MVRALLLDLYAAAIHGADAHAATLDALRAQPLDAGARCWIIALGKGAPDMARAAVVALAERGREPHGGIIVAAGPAESPHASLAVVVGDHPVPGDRSLAAAERVAEVAAAVGRDDAALVLLSGGTTSLVAAPIDGVSAADLSRLFDGLLASGADIGVMNALRKRFCRWGAGRLAQALAPSPVRCLVISDVLGDEPATIGSGPCAPDPHTAADLLALIERQGLEPYVPSPLRALLADVAGGSAPETPKPGDPIFERVSCEVVLANRHALAAAAAAARDRGVAPIKVVPDPLDDEAALVAPRIVDELIRFREGGLLVDGAGHDVGAPAALGCMFWGGETTVRLGGVIASPGGRCQELALAAARALFEAGERGHGITLLAAGTDGRDGPTDAAGAIVDAATWDAISVAGRDPERDLVEHESHAALDSVSALVRTGLTGTNVQDVVIGIVERRG